MKKVYYLLTICFFLQLEIFSQSGWNLIYNFSESITDITFNDSLIGLATSAVDPKIYKTEDGGVTWRTINTTGLISKINDIIFYNDEICFGVGKNGTVIKSVDSGNTWSIGSVGDQDELRTIYSSPGGNLFICQRSGNYIYKSTDQGVSWSKIFSNSTGYMYDFGFINENIGYLVGDSMVKTTNGGNNWERINDILHLGPNKRIKFVNENMGYRLAYNYTGGTVVKTTNGGNTWFVVYDNNYGSGIADLTLIGNDTLWAVGYNNIIKSTDAGLNWFHQTLTPPTDLYKTVSVSPLTCFILSGVGTLYKTLDGGLSPPSLSSPYNNSSGLSLITSLRWNSFTWGNPFEIQIARDSIFNNIFLDTLKYNTSLEINNFDLNTKYYWRVREKYGNLYSPWSEIWNFKTTAGAPTLASPFNNSIDIPLSATFIWNDVTLNADSYQLQLSEDSNFSQLYFNDTTITQNTFELSGLADSILYFWRVRVKVRSNYGDWSSIWQFRTLAKTARLLSPLNNATISPVNITMQWSPTSQTINYRLQVSADSLFLDNVIDQDNIIALTTTISLDYGGKYYWRLGAKNQDGNTYWSDYFIFFTRLKPTTSFPLEIGNKWYYKAGSTRDYYYFGVEKEITDTLSNGFKEVTCKYLYTDKITIEKEYWAYIDGKFYLTDYNRVYYNDYLTRDTCSSTGIVRICWHLLPHQIFGVFDTAQVYSDWTSIHGNTAGYEVTIFPEIGIEKVWHYSYFISETRDSIYLIGMLRNGVVLGDTVISSPPIFVGDDWVVKPSGTTNDLNSVFFTDRYNGTIVGNNGTILRTTDGGKSWRTQISRLKSKLNSVFFIDSNIGWIVADDDTMITTSDGGSTWNSKKTGVIPYLYDISFADFNKGIAVGSWGLVMYTSNGGTSWNSQYIGNTPELFAIDFRYLDNATAVSWNGYIYNTSNSGLTWNQQSMGTSASLYDIFYIDQNNGIVVGVGGKILRTTNGGATWLPQTTGIDKSLFAVHFTDLNRGVVVGSRGKILRTIDGGSNWITQLSGTINDLNDVTFTDAKNGWIVGSGGLILHTTSTSELVSNPILPANHSIEIMLPVKFNWSSVPNILNYTLQISTNSSFSDPIINFSGLTDTSIIVGSLHYKRDYFWRVKTISKLGYEYWSQTWKFRTADSTSEIISNPILPANNSIEIVLPVKFNWSSVPNILNYTLQISTNSSFSDSLLDFANLTDTSYTVNSLNYAKQYFWKVKTISSLGYEYWSPVWKFTTVDSPIEFNLSQNYPNPFNPVTIIKYSLANKQIVKLKIYDILGKEVATLVNEEKPAGRYSAEFYGSGLASGIYFYRLQAGDYVETRKMILLK